MASTGDKLQKVLAKLKWMKDEKIWPNGIRYLWTDAHGVCALLSLYHHFKDSTYLDQAEEVVKEVYRVLGRKRGLRIGEEPDRDGQYFHYLTKWIFALNQLGKIKPEYHERAVNLVKDVHGSFVIPGVGVHWKMLEDLSEPYPGYGLGGLDYYDGYVQYRLLDSTALSKEIGQMGELVQKDYKHFSCTQDLGLGESLWLSHFFPDEPWAHLVRQRSEETLAKMWIDADKNSGYFCRHPKQRSIKFAFTNFGVSYGLQSYGLWPEKVDKLNKFFESYKSGDEYDRNSITHVMNLNSIFPGVMLSSFH